MSYLIRRREPVDSEVRRVLAGQVERAAALLVHWQDDPRDNIHQARQAFKRVRALLRLIRPGAAYVYRAENPIFRALGRDLGCARDAEAVVDAAKLLGARLPAPLPMETLRTLRLGLERRAAREHASGVHDVAGRAVRACEALAAAARRIPDMPLEDLRRKDLRRGVAAAVERCTATYQRAAASGAEEALHGWRIQVKYAFHQSRLMQQLMPEWAGEAGPQLEAIGRQLGQHHDLVVLARLLRDQADELAIEAQLRPIRHAVQGAQVELAEAALAAGGRLFAAAAATAGNVVEFSSGA